MNESLIALIDFPTSSLVSNLKTLTSVNIASPLSRVFYLPLSEIDYKEGSP